jgi:DNA polymerase-3 subunit delta'
MRGDNFPDFLSIKPDGQNIKIDQIRALNRRLSFAPVVGRYRVSVICLARTMTDEAANSFLKNLEEPPPGNILILNTTEPRDLLPTIVSRCQRVPFQPLAVQDMTNWLVKNRHLTEESAIVLSKISAGSLGRALKMCEGDFLEKRQKWLLRLLTLGGISMEKSLEMALECAGEDKNASLDISENGESGMTDMLATWETWYRDLLLCRIGGPDHLLINVDFSHKLKKSAGSSTIENLIDSVLAVDKAQRDLRRMRNPALVMEHTVLSLKRLAG